jgi:hypothetical protein
MVSPPQIAPKAADVTLVVFSDYQCPYCQKFHPELRQLLAQDSKLHLIYRDWPIFGEISVVAARLPSRPNICGRHEAFDDALMAMPGKVDAAAIREAATRAGIDWKKLQSDFDPPSGHRRIADPNRSLCSWPRASGNTGLAHQPICDVRCGGSGDVEISGRQGSPEPLSRSKGERDMGQKQECPRR